MNASWLFLAAYYMQQHHHTNATVTASNVVPAPIWLQIIVWAFIAAAAVAVIAMIVSILKDIFR